MKYLRWVTAFICLVVSVSALSTALESRAQARSAHRLLASLSGDAQELLRLRARSRELPARPTEGLAGRVSAALARSGLPAGALQGVSPEAESLIGEAGRRARRQRATLTLSGLSLPQFGGFLDAWRSTEPDWVVASIDMTPIERNGAPTAPPAGSDLPLRVVLVIEGIFREGPPGAKP